MVEPHLKNFGYYIYVIDKMLANMGKPPLRWGSGAYEIKKRLGFSMEDNGALAFFVSNPIVQNFIRRFI